MGKLEVKTCMVQTMDKICLNFHSWVASHFSKVGYHPLLSECQVQFMLHCFPIIIRFGRSG